MTESRSPVPALALAAASVLLGVAATLLVQRWTGADRPPDVDVTTLAALPAPDAGLQRELERLRQEIARLEEQPPRSEPDAPGSEDRPIDPALEARIERLEAMLTRLASGPDASETAESTDSETDARTAAKLVGQVFDGSAAMRTRLDSLQVLGRMDPAADLFKAVDLGALGGFVASIADDERRRRTWRSLRGHVDRDWLPVIRDAAKREPVDRVRAELLELLAPLVEDPEVRAFLEQLARDPSLGDETRDALRDLVR